MKLKLKLMNFNKASKSWFSNCGALSDTAGKCTENVQKQGAAKKVLIREGGVAGYISTVLTQNFNPVFNPSLNHQF